jgi:hypothetical protein
MIPFSLMWGGFAIYWESLVLVGGGPLFLELWGIPFVLFGLYLIFGRFWVDARRRNRTYYGVTSERVIIVSAWIARRVQSLNLDTLSDITMTQKANGAGVIAFGPAVPWYAWRRGPGWSTSRSQNVPCLELSDEVRRVHEIIRSAQRARQHVSPT